MTAGHSPPWALCTVTAYPYCTRSALKYGSRATLRWYSSYPSWPGDLGVRLYRVLKATLEVDKEGLLQFVLWVGTQTTG